MVFSTIAGYFMSWFFVLLTLYDYFWYFFLIPYNWIQIFSTSKASECVLHIDIPDAVSTAPARFISAGNVSLYIGELSSESLRHDRVQDWVEDAVEVVEKSF